MPLPLPGRPDAEECLQAWRNKYSPPDKKRERDAFCDRLKKGDSQLRQKIYEMSCSTNPSIIANFRPMLNRECDISEKDPVPMLSPSKKNSAPRPAGSRSPSPTASSASSRSVASASSSSRSPSPTASSASSRSAPERYDIGDCDEYRDAEACDAVDKCVWTGDLCLPRSATHVAMDAGERPSRERPSGASLGAVLSLAGAVTTAGVAASRPGAAFGGPGASALKPRAVMALPASHPLSRHKELTQLLNDKPQRIAMDEAQNMGLINSTPTKSWEQSFREALYGRRRRRAARR